ncbi:MAG: CHAT domain-containing protein [Melioribacteraceae bacterium]|nr:CHAT domain-containing protein [Melioribacteraceae bacterium]
MHRFNVVLKYGLSLLFLLIQLNGAAPHELNDVKKRVVGKDFPQDLLVDYEFYLLNNKIDFENELNFLSNLNSSFETEYLQSLILFKNNYFEKSFNQLLDLLKDTPKHYPYYDLLSKSAYITNNKVKIENDFAKLSSSKHLSYLKAQLAYQNAEYQKAKDFFNEVLKSDSTSFHPYFMIAYTCRNLGEYGTALKYFNKADELVKTGSPFTAKVRIAIGSLFYLSGNFDKAKELYESGFKIAAETGNNSEKIKALLNIGMLLDLEGAIEKARINFDEASKLSADIGDYQLEATCLSEYAVSFTYTGEEVNARDKYLESFSLFEKLGNKKRLALTAINIGNSFLNISNYKSSVKYFEIGLNEAGENVRTKMLALQGLGDVYTNLADYTKALDYYNRAKALAKQIKDVPVDAEINIGLGILYYNLDMPNKALKILEESGKSLIDSENPYIKLEIEQKIGIIYSSIDSLSLATNYLNKSSILANEYGDVYSEILSNTFLAEIKIKQKDLSSAYSLLQSTMETTMAIDYTQMLGVQHLLLSEISREKLNVKKQVEHIKRAMAYAEKSNDYNTLIRSNQKLGEIYAASNDFDKAEEYFLTAINLIDINFNRLFSKADIQIKFFSNYYSVYNSLISIYLSENNFVKAFEMLEKSKGKNTNQHLVALQLDNSEESNKLLNRYYDLDWKQRSGLYSTKELLSIKNGFEKVKNSISQINPKAEEILNNYLNSSNQFSIEDIQSSLSNNLYIISYFIQENNIFAFQLSSDNLIVERISISRNELNELKKSISPYYDDTIGGNEISFNKDLFAFNAEGSRVFFEKILQPIISDIPTSSKLVFSLPSEMLTIPFELLVTKANIKNSPYLLDDKRFLIDDYNVSYTPSLLIWDKLKSKNISNVQKVLLIGDPYFANPSNLVAKERGIVDEIDFTSRNMELLRLEYSADEILSIGSLISSVKTYLSKNATETIFKNNVEDASIVHLSTHSFLYKNNPLILFSSNDKENDGVLEVGEILNLNLISDMVVLSSCKSGLGNVDKAEGIIGMQKAFFDAGAKSVVVSLWDINDKYTSIFMKYFYSFLSKDVSKSEALRLAKLKFRKEDNSNPYYWAAFVFSGNDVPINFQTSRGISPFVYIGVVLLLILAYFLFIQKSKKGVILKNV